MKITIAILSLLASFSQLTLTYADNPSPSTIQGKWWILGNVTRGTLELSIDADNKVTGTIYNQPVRGNWQSDRSEITFIRYSDESASIPMQSWKGKLVEVDCNSRKVYVLEGTFQTLDVGTEEEKKREYQWSGQSVDSPAPNLDLKNLQGEWQIANIFTCTKPDVKLPNEIGLVNIGARFKIQGNQIRVGNDVTATLANDLQSPTLASQVGFDGSRVMVVTTASGQGLICSYFIENDVAEIAYPHTAFCHRGSGHILRLTRIK